MIRQLFLSLLLLGAFTEASRGDTPVCPGGRPTIPAPGIHPALADKTNLGTLHARAFFEARRAAEPSCVTELGGLRTAYLAEREKLAKLAGSSDLDALDDQASLMEQARDEWVAKLRVCGNCWSQEIDLCSVTSPARTEYWYVGDGSCQIESKDVKILSDAYDAQSSSLSTVDFYRHYSGGFPNVLDFLLVDPKTGAQLTSAKTDPAAPFYSFISVKGPSILGIQVGFGYFYKNTQAPRQSGSVKEYIHTFESERPPRGFQYPQNVPLHLASGRKLNVKPITLTLVQGMWYLTSAGYLRYYTAADLGMNLDFAKKAAQSTMLTTLVTLHERGAGEAP